MTWAVRVVRSRYVDSVRLMRIAKDLREHGRAEPRQPLVEDELAVDVGAEIANLVVADRGNPVLTRFVPVGLVDFVAGAADCARVAPLFATASDFVWTWSLS